MGIENQTHVQAPPNAIFKLSIFYCCSICDIWSSFKIGFLLIDEILQNLLNSVCTSFFPNYNNTTFAIINL